MQRQIERTNKPLKKLLSKFDFLAERICTLFFEQGFPILTTFPMKTSTLLLAISSVSEERESSVHLGHLHQRIKELRGKNG